MKRTLIILFMILLLFPIITGQTPEKKQYKATKITVPPEIDGILDEESWKSGNWIGDFTQWQPYNGRPESQRTEFKIVFDDNNLYVAIKAFDASPDSIVRRLGRKDNTDGDWVAII